VELTRLQKERKAKERLAEKHNNRSWEKELEEVESYCQRQEKMEGTRGQPMFLMERQTLSSSSSSSFTVNIGNWPYHSSGDYSRKPGFAPRAVHEVFIMMGAKRHCESFLSEFFCFPVNIIQPGSHIHVIWAMNNRPIVDRSSETPSHPIDMNNTNKKLLSLHSHRKNYQYKLG
jgi:hypothetical protein